MRQDMLLSIGAGVASAVAFALVLFNGIFMLTAYFALLPLMALGFRVGASAVSVAAFAGSVSMLFVAGLPFFMVFAITVALPSMTAMRVALQPKPTEPGRQPELCGLGEVLTALSMTGVVVMLVTAVTLGYSGTGLFLLLDEGMQTVIEHSGLGENAEMAEAFKSLVVYVPALLATSWVLMAAINLLVAHSVAEKFGPVLRRRLSIQEIVLPAWLLPLLAAAMLGGFILDGTPGLLAQNAMFMLALPFVGTGLALVHRVASQYSFKRPALIVFYLVATLSQIGPFLIAALGVVEHILQSRPRKSGS